MNALLIDISRYNGRANWQEVKNSGVNGVIIKGGGIYSLTGVCYTDDLLADHIAGAKSVNIPYGIYWYWLPFENISQQISSYRKLIEYYNPPIKAAFIDVESNNGKASTQITEGLKKFLPAFTDITNMSVIYTRQSWWDINVKPDPMWTNYSLWASRWASTLTSPWSDGRYVFRDWKNWTFWQFSGDNNIRARNFGFPGSPPSGYTGDKYKYGDPDLDLNVFNGDLEAFKLWASLKNETQPCLTVEETLKDHERRLILLEAKAR